MLHVNVTLWSDHVKTINYWILSSGCVSKHLLYTNINKPYSTPLLIHSSYMNGFSLAFGNNLIVFYS